MTGKKKNKTKREQISIGVMKKSSNSSNSNRTVNPQDLHDTATPEDVKWLQETAIPRFEGWLTESLVSFKQMKNGKTTGISDTMTGILISEIKEIAQKEFLRKFQRNTTTQWSQQERAQHRHDFEYCIFVELKQLVSLKLAAVLMQDVNIK